MKKILIPFLLAFVLLLGGCAENEEGTYRLYGLNSTGNALNMQTYHPESADAETQVLEMLTFMTDKSGLKEKTEDSDWMALLPENVVLDNYEYKGNLVTLDFSENFEKLDAGRKNMIYAGFTLGLTQIEGVTRVRFLSGGQDVTDSYGDKIGILNADSFMDDTGMDVNSYQYITLQLYFLNEDGTEIDAEERSVYYSGNISLERVVVEELIKGPGQSSHASVLSSDASVLSAVQQDGQSYINLDEGSAAVVGLKDSEISVQAIVTSILENCQTEGVQLSVDGDVIYNSIRDTVEKTKAAVTTTPAVTATPTATAAAETAEPAEGDTDSTPEDNDSDNSDESSDSSAMDETEVPAENS